MRRFISLVVFLSVFLSCAYFVEPASAQSSNAEVQNLLSKGDAFIDSSQYLEAIDAYNKVLELEPENGDAYAGLGTTDYFLNKYQDALEKFDKAEEYGVTGDWLEGIYAYRGNCLLNLNEPERAIEAFQKLKEINPKSKFVKVGLQTARMMMKFK